MLDVEVLLKLHEEPRSLQFLLQRVSVDVLSGNAACVTGTDCSAGLFLGQYLYD
jgi:hypothetical protein